MAKKITTKEQLTDFLLYTIPNNDIKVEAFLYNENVWLTQKRMSELFEVGKSTISEHLTNIFESKELDKNSVVRNFRTMLKMVRNTKLNFKFRCNFICWLSCQFYTSYTISYLAKKS